jgi:3-oxoacyl-[acyl-carrier protein] reductase
MDLGLAGRVAVVQAASRGLGRAIALELAREGARVALCARGRDALERTARELRATTGAELFAAPADVSRPTERAAFFDAVERTLGPPAILVCNAGGPPPGAFEATTPEAWQQALATNLLSAVESCRRVLPAMRAARWGRIVLVTSLAVKQPLPGLMLSNAARAGATGFAKSLANEVAADGVTVNCVCPGTHRTDRIRALLDAGPEPGGRARLERELLASIPLGRMGEPEELAAAVAFLCSARASFVTGISLAVDGGASRSLLS